MNYEVWQLIADQQAAEIDRLRAELHTKTEAALLLANDNSRLRAELAETTGIIPGSSWEPGMLTTWAEEHARAGAAEARLSAVIAVTERWARGEIAWSPELVRQVRAAATGETHA